MLKLFGVKMTYLFNKVIFHRMWPTRDSKDMFHAARERKSSPTACIPGLDCVDMC